MVHLTLRSVKTVLSSNQKIKILVKKSLLPHIGSFVSGSNKYNSWLKNNIPDAICLVRMQRELESFNYRPLISVVVPVYNTNIIFLKDCIDSVISQAYDNWELCIVDDASPNGEVREIIKQYAKIDERIKYKFLKSNQHIAGATNQAIALAKGEFISLFDHDDVLWPNALYEVVKALNKDNTIDFMYSDEDKITEDRRAYQSPFFKPDWNPDFLHSVNYITHFTTIRKTLIDKVGGLKKEYNGAQDWDLFMRITGETDKIYHIPTVVYSWRIHDLSTAKSIDSKPYVVEAQRKAIQDDLSRKGRPDALVKQDPKNKGYWMVEYPIVGEPLVSIIIPTKNQYKVVSRCISSIYEKTQYKNFEIILVDTGSTDKRVLGWYKKIIKLHSNLRVIVWPEVPFSYARSCNEGARQARGELLLMLNNDTEVITPNWLELLAGDAQRKSIGAVGCLLYFPDKVHIQHAGIGIGLGGVAANTLSMAVDCGLTQNQHLYLNTKHNITAVTAACLMIRKDVYDKVGGFDEKFRVTYNDVDLCLRLREKGLYNVYIPNVKLIHHESISVGLPDEKKKRDTSEMQAAIKLFKNRWRKYIDYDPNLNPNIDKNNAFYDVNADRKLYK